MTFRRLLGLFTLLMIVLAGARSAHAAGPAQRHVAIVVGANEPPPGRSALRFAHDDARTIADALVRVGRFASGDVHVLLDPHPAELVAAIDAVARSVAAEGGQALFVFYYSGHSDGQMVYPHGEALALSDLRDRIERVGARIRVGILDTCRGGSWTQSKGLSVGPPLDVQDLLNVTTEGTALVSSSSGIENAHEAAAVQGSFFTHYFAAGLLGAADRTGDGNITLQEAFDYAKERTVRDSARLAMSPQHPSFDLVLRGRQDIVLSVVSSSTSAVEVSATRAPVEIIHLQTGVTIAEAPMGQGPVRIAVPPGRYLVRTVVDGTVYTKEVDIQPGATVSVGDGQLDATGSAQLAMKGGEEPKPIDASSTPPKHWWVLQASAGVTNEPQTTATITNGSTGASSGFVNGTSVSRNFTWNVNLAYGITDRLAWAVPFPALAYRFGTEGRVEVIARAGLTSPGYSSREGYLGTLDAGLALRVWTAPGQSIIADTSANDYLATSPEDYPGSRDYLRLFGAVGYSWTIKNTVTLNLAVGANAFFYSNRGGASPLPTQYGNVQLGSIQTLGFRDLPLVEVHLAKSFSLDGFASWSFNPAAGTFQDTYKGGFTVAF
jgi:hypothetical protein